MSSGPAPHPLALGAPPHPAPGSGSVFRGDIPHGGRRGCGSSLCPQLSESSGKRESAFPGPRESRASRSADATRSLAPSAALALSGWSTRQAPAGRGAVGGAEGGRVLIGQPRHMSLAPEGRARPRVPD